VPILAGDAAIHGSRSEFEPPSIHTSSPETLWFKFPLEVRLIFREYLPFFVLLSILLLFMAAAELFMHLNHRGMLRLETR